MGQEDVMATLEEVKRVMRQTDGTYEGALRVMGRRAERGACQECGANPGHRAACVTGRGCPNNWSSSGECTICRMAVTP